MHAQPPVPHDRASTRGLASARARLAGLLGEAFYPLLTAILSAKSLAAVALINNPDHSVLVPSALQAYEWSPVIFVSFVAILLAPAFLFGGRRRLAFYLGADLAFSLLTIGDLWYFRACSTFLSFVLSQQTANFANLSTAVVAMFRPVDLVFLADLAALVPVVLAHRSIGTAWRRSVGRAAGHSLAGVAALVAMHIRLDVVGNGTDQRFLEPCWEARQTISYQSPLGFHLFDLWDFLRMRRGVALTAARRAEIAAWFAANREDAPASAYSGVLRGRNLIVVQVESLETFYVGHRVAGQEITPAINALLPQSIVFTSIHDQANEGLSSDSDLMVNTSVYPRRKGGTFFSYPDTTYNSLPRLLRGAGYRQTVALHPDRGVYWNWMNALTHLGFDRCFDMTAFPGGETIGLGLSDAAFLAGAAEVVRGLPEPFYAFLVTLTSHEPFDLPPALRELALPAGLADSVLGRSFQCFRYTDRQIGRFLEALRTGGLLDRSVVVICGDHAGVHRFFADEIADLQGIEPGTTDARLLVPFIVHASGLPGTVVPVTGGQIDIMPTLLSLLGVDRERWAGTVMGRDLLATARDFAVLPDGRVVGRDATTPRARAAVEGLGIADDVISGDYFRVAGLADPVTPRR